jgi:phage gp29-like protein
MNFGREALVPGFAFITDDLVDLLKFSLAIGNLAKAGLRIPAAHVYDVAGIPQPKEDEVVLEPIAAPIAEVEPDDDEVDPNPEEGGDKPADEKHQKQRLAA